ncbi:MAG: 6-carboxytetrahydropterin synthase [Methylococcaceae bacterium]|nr:6-carboxytetrahydropterin synthase [Methylococcaceae bacterium]MCI0666696.1 6-carboxytetrahydropterin synthase [Methylococcaceae bacterium]MCI0732915.1 6-carboxytetrahydropterin synthase [Methylococcaceae bacterium]
MYQLAITRDFFAQHFLIGGDFGKENRRHSHRYKVEVRIEAPELDRHGYLVDIVDLEAALSKIIETFQENTLNDLAPFRGLNPSLEHFARIIWESLVEKLEFDRDRLSVKLWENDADWAAYRWSGTSLNPE